ncbi:alkaline phosphatase [Kineosporia sp. R_H_3]|uniref:alkaline phosphatase D family protein n=1 Tax=Kineosporia sp. R_H_3 TaxID=1961848 RepID=UPI000B4ABA2B|nr:alkaline phosphatase D family protein [Kineosporia sp. R_H_3]
MSDIARPRNAAPTPPDRRTVLRTGGVAAAALAGAAALTVVDVRPAHALAVRQDPFALGVASGDPLPTAVVLWTRLVRDPFSAASMGDADVEVRWEVAGDPSFRSVVRRGTALARRRYAHSVHVDVTGLSPGTDYWYRFRAASYVSPTGRTRTTPAAGTRPGRVRFAVASCQNLQQGYWPAYTALAAEDVDLVLHLGDYIYETDPKSSLPGRRHTTPRTPGLNQLRTLGDYRARHAQYKLDPALQAAHAAAPWMAVWDDHEVENNYADLVDDVGDTGARHQSRAAFATQRTAGYQAYWEHLPLRPRPTFGTPAYRVYRGADFGTLLRLNVLDTRQYRTDQPGGYAHDLGPESAGRRSTTGTLTGTAQERWLTARMATSAATWNVVAQQTVMARTRWPAPLGTLDLPFLANLDQWDGYASQRTRLLRRIVADAVANPVVLSADVHSTWFNDLVVDPDDPHAPVVASELVAPAISSRFVGDAEVRRTLRSLNPWTRYFDGSRRGYLLMDVDRDRWLVRARTVESVTSRTSPVRTTARFAVAAGTPGVVRA